MIMLVMENHDGYNEVYVSSKQIGNRNDPGRCKLIPNRMAWQWAETLVELGEL